jgi:hypothetical protein
MRVIAKSHANASQRASREIHHTSMGASEEAKLAGDAKTRKPAGGGSQ